MITYSFVIPHHNTPDLLQRLIDSVPQRGDVEIIVVDDNSDKNKKANVFRSDVTTIFIDEEHTKGAGHARNVGMDTAKGTWILFADADDFYKPNFMDVLDEYKDDDIEMLFFNVDAVDCETLQPLTEYRSKFHQRQFEEFDGSEESIANFLFWGYGPWRKMMRRDFINKFEIRFEEIPVSNDSFFSLQASYFVKKWKMDKRILYSLSLNRNSLTYSPVTKKKYSTYLYLFPRRREFFKYIGHPEWNLKSMKGYHSQSCFRYIFKLIKKQPFTGFEALYYYLTHFIWIEQSSDLYIKKIENIKRKKEKV